MPKLTLAISAFAFAALELAAAFGIAYFAPTPQSQSPDFERLMFILLPIGGAGLGSFLFFLGTPLPKNVTVRSW